MYTFDFLVIGGGIAGLSYALEVASHGSVAVLFKKEIDDSSTNWAQGGIAAVSGEDDNFELHIQDTLTAGAGLCKRAIVELVVQEGDALAAERIRGGRLHHRGGEAGRHRGVERVAAGQQHAHARHCHQRMSR